jgi:hypothetical protein
VLVRLGRFGFGGWAGSSFHLLPHLDQASCGLVWLVWLGWSTGCGCGWVEHFCCLVPKFSAGRVVSGWGGFGMLLGPEKTPVCGCGSWCHLRSVLSNAPRVVVLVGWWRWWGRGVVVC